MGNCLVRVGVTRLAYLRTAAAAAKSLQSCPTVQPHRRQLTRLPRPWDSPGKNIGVGCHVLLQCMKAKSEVAQSCLTLSDSVDCSPPGSSVHGIFQARVLGVPLPSPCFDIVSRKNIGNYFQRVLKYFSL